MFMRLGRVLHYPYVVILISVAKGQIKVFIVSLLILLCGVYRVSGSRVRHRVSGSRVRHCAWAHAHPAFWRIFATVACC